MAEAESMRLTSEKFEELSKGERLDIMYFKFRRRGR